LASKSEITSASDNIVSVASKKSKKIIDLELLDEQMYQRQLKAEEAKRKASGNGYGGKDAHCPLFPFNKKESWYVALVSTSSTHMSALLGMLKVPYFEDEVIVQFQWQAPEVAGEYKMEVQARCDSYIGVDVVKPLKLQVLKLESKPLSSGSNARSIVADVAKPKKQKRNKSKKVGRKLNSVMGDVPDPDTEWNPEDYSGNEADDSDDDNDDKNVDSGDKLLGDEEEDGNTEEEEEEKSWLQALNEQEGKWYYLGAPNIFEFLVYLVIFYFLSLYGHSFLHQRGLWQKYFQPTIDIVWTHVEPTTTTVYAVVEPVLAPFTGIVVNVLDRFLGRGDYTIPDNIVSEKKKRAKPGGGKPWQ
jgi:hypothetical protein